MAASGPVIIDWPDAARGHPIGDVVRTWLLIRLGGIPSNPILRAFTRLFRSYFTRAYLDAYFSRSPYSRVELDAWLLPVLVARLSEGIREELEDSKKLIERFLRKSDASDH